MTGTAHSILNTLNIILAVTITSHVVVEYVWPFIKRRILPTPPAITRKLQLKQPITLTEHEEQIAMGAVHPDDIDVYYSDISGHERTLKTLKQCSQLLLSTAPMNRKKLGGYNEDNVEDEILLPKSRFMQPPKGVLLYGPPGCGKTMIAKAMAKESGVAFLSINIATLMDRWVGETEKYCEAIFTLAAKIAPVIVFIDEIDALTRQRGAFDANHSAMMKSHLLSLWDGLLSEREGSGGILILGATNRLSDIDEAFKRRMPLQLQISLPSLETRFEILCTLLDDAALGFSNDGGAGELPIFMNDGEIKRIARECEGFSGSDLFELVRRCVMNCQLEPGTFFLDYSAFLQEVREIKQTRN